MGKYAIIKTSDLFVSDSLQDSVVDGRVDWTTASVFLGIPWFILVSFCILNGRELVGGSLFGLAITATAMWMWKLWGRGRGELYLLTFLVSLSLFHIGYVIGLPIPLSGDEALFWDCSRKMAWCFVTKGPGTPFCIWCTRMLLGNTELGVRSGAIALFFAASCVMYLLGRRLYNARVGLCSAILLQIIPIYAFNGFAMTTDPLFIFLWLLSLLMLHRAWTSNRVLDWLIVGFIIGLGILAKYTMVIFFLPALLFILTSPSRKHLLGIRPYAALTLCLAVSSPLIIWNARHGWVNILHNFGHTHASDGFKISLKYFGRFFGSQVGTVGPLLLPMIIWASIKLRKKDPLSFWFTIIPVVFFLLKSLQGKVLTNWAQCSYLAGLVSFSEYFLARYDLLKKPSKRLTRIAIITAIIMTMMLHIAPVMEFPKKMDPLKKVRFGSVQLGREVTQLSKQLKPERFIFSNNYMISSLLGFYVDGRPDTYCVDTGRRINEFDVWPGFQDLDGYDAVLVLKGDTPMPELLQDKFMSYQKHLLKVFSAVGRTENIYSVFLCRDFKGMKRVIPTQYN